MDPSYHVCIKCVNADPHIIPVVFVGVDRGLICLKCEVEPAEVVTNVISVLSLEEKKELWGEDHHSKEMAMLLDNSNLRATKPWRGPTVETPSPNRKRPRTAIPTAPRKRPCVKSPIRTSTRIRCTPKRLSYTK